MVFSWDTGNGVAEGAETDAGGAGDTVLPDAADLSDAGDAGDASSVPDAVSHVENGHADAAVPDDAASDAAADAAHFTSAGHNARRVGSVVASRPPHGRLSGSAGRC